MNLKNYTSEVPVARSMAQIHQKLVEVGADNINYKILDKITVGITFLYTDPKLKRTLAFHIKAQVDEAFNIMIAQYKKLQSDTKKRVKEQAARTAWKILSDWIEIQCSMILLGQAEPLQMFLPFVYDVEKDETLYDKLSAGKMTNLLPSPK